MRHHQTTLIAVLVFGLCAAFPAVASAGSLLSGYGGPGQGSQAILGSALLNGPSGGGGSTSSGARTGAQPAGAAPASGAPAGSGGRRAGAAGSSSGTGKHGARGAGAGRAGASGHGSRALVGQVSDTSAVGGRTLGLSGEDLVYMFMALAVLAITGALTRRWGHQPKGE
ncbi:MAG TPA: hypothetical protein VMF09_05245 [Solirubrobacteraceae bacterium]|nr:hypothetical protein [Solirubrobacteraceae bacterium]